MPSELPIDVLRRMFRCVHEYRHDFEYAAMLNNMLACVRVCKVWYQPAKESLYSDIMMREPEQQDPIRQLSQEEVEEMLAERLGTEVDSSLDPTPTQAASSSSQPPALFVAEDQSIHNANQAQPASATASEPGSNSYTSDEAYIQIQPATQQAEEDDLMPTRMTLLLACLKNHPENAAFIKELDFDHYRGLDLLGHCLQLERLRFGNYRDPQSSYDSLMDWSAPALPRLRWMTLEQVHPAFVRAVMDCSPGLMEVSIVLNSLWDDGYWTNWQPRLPSMRTLCIKGENLPSAPAMKAIISACADSLQALHLIRSYDDQYPFPTSDGIWVDSWLPPSLPCLRTFGSQQIAPEDVRRVMAASPQDTLAFLSCDLNGDDLASTEAFLNAIPSSLDSLVLGCWSWPEIVQLVTRKLENPKWLPGLWEYPRLYNREEYISYPDEARLRGKLQRAYDARSMLSLRH